MKKIIVVIMLFSLTVNGYTNDPKKEKRELRRKYRKAIKKSCIKEERKMFRVYRRYELKLLRNKNNL